jgi:hypothetical protein
VVPLEPGLDAWLDLANALEANLMVGRRQSGQTRSRTRDGSSPIAIAFTNPVLRQPCQAATSNDRVHARPKDSGRLVCRPRNPDQRAGRRTNHERAAHLAHHSNRRGTVKHTNASLKHNLIGGHRGSPASRPTCHLYTPTGSTRDRLAAAIANAELQRQRTCIMKSHSAQHHCRSRPLDAQTRHRVHRPPRGPHHSGEPVPGQLGNNGNQSQKYWAWEPCPSGPSLGPHGSTVSSKGQGR